MESSDWTEDLNFKLFLIVRNLDLNSTYQWLQCRIGKFYRVLPRKIYILFMTVSVLIKGCVSLLLHKPTYNACCEKIIIKLGIMAWFEVCRRDGWWCNKNMKCKSMNWLKTYPCEIVHRRDMTFVLIILVIINIYSESLCELRGPTIVSRNSVFCRFVLASPDTQEVFKAFF